MDPILYKGYEIHVWADGTAGVTGTVLTPKLASTVPYPERKPLYTWSVDLHPATARQATLRVVNDCKLWIAARVKLDREIAQALQDLDMENR